MLHIASWRATLARLYSEAGQLEPAREQVDLLRANGFDLPRNWSWPTCISALSEAVSDLNDRAAAAVLYERLRPVARQVPMTVGMLTRWDDAERHFADALAMNERLGARPYVVRTRRAWASMLLDRNAPGDAARARDLIAAGRAEAETLGMARELVRFERLTERMAGAATG